MVVDVKGAVYCGGHVQLFRSNLKMKTGKGNQQYIYIYTGLVKIMLTLMDYFSPADRSVNHFAHIVYVLAYYA